MNKYILIISLAILLANCKNKINSTDNEVVIPVKVEVVETQILEQTISVSGTAKPSKSVILRTEIGGHYQLQINPRTGKKFALGDKVKTGDVIVKLIDEEYENNIKIETAKLRLEITRQTVDKQKSLYEKGGVTLNDLKNTEIEHINAKYAYEDALLRLNKMKVGATFDGVLVDVPYFTQGNKVPASTVVATIMNYRKMYMDVMLAENNYEKVRTRQKVRILNYTIKKDTINGIVSQVSPAIDENSRAFKGIIEIDNVNLNLRPGMYARADIVVQKIDSAFVVPKEVFMIRNNSKVVFIAKKGYAEKIKIETGIETPVLVQITKGLKVGDKLIIKGYETLQNKTKIRVEK